MAVTRRLAAIMFTDLVGFTASAQTDESAALGRLREEEALVRPLFARFEGREIKSTGDGSLVEFPSALKAVECAVEVQRQLHERNARRPETPIALRIGIHVGDVEERGGDIFGDSVNVASRVVPLADSGGVCLSGDVVSQVRNKVPFSLERIGPRTLKGVRSSVDLYRVVLPWVRPTPGVLDRAEPRLAVLPLANISPETGDAYFADGLTEELISVLSRIPGLRVIGRTSVAPYRSITKPLAEIGSELGVSSVLEGSVRKAGDRLRITLQLIDVASQEHTWTESYDRQLTDVFAIQSEVAESTAKAIRLELTGPDREAIRRRPTTNLEAYELYLRATARSDEISPKAFREAEAFLEEALRKDPEFAAAHARLAHVLVQAAGDWLPHDEAFPRARRAIARALELDPTSSEAHAALGNLLTQDDHDWARAEVELRTAIALNPSNSTAHFSYSVLLRVLDRIDECEEQLREAIVSDPSWTDPRRALVDYALARGDFDAATERTRRWLDPDPAPWIGHLNFAFGYAAAGRAAEARRELGLVEESPDLFRRAGRAFVLALLGETDEARRLADAAHEGGEAALLPKDFVVALYGLTGEKQKALDLLEELIRRKESGLWIRHWSAIFDPIRDDPRFLAALRAQNIPEAVLRSGLNRGRPGSTDEGAPAPRT